MSGIKPLIKRPLLALSLLSILLGGTCPASLAADSPKTLVSTFPPQAQLGATTKTVDGADMLQDLLAAAGSLKAYTVTFEMTVFKGKKTIFEKGNFYFEKPRLLRVEEVGDYKRGAVAVIGKDGKIRGHLGGPLSPFTVTLSEDSDQLLSANGYPMVDSDFASMYRVTQSFVKRGMKSRVSERPVAVDGHPEKVYVLEVFDGSQPFKRAYIHSQTLLPVEWFDYQDGRLYARTIWKNLRITQNLSDDLFKL